MRQILVERARLQAAEKRGPAIKISLDDQDRPNDQGALDPETLLTVSDSLTRLQKIDPRKHQIVELRFYMGLDNQQIAELLEISDSTVRREWQNARLWLARDMRPQRPGD